MNLEGRNYNNNKKRDSSSKIYWIDEERKEGAYVMKEVRASVCSVSAFSATYR